MNLTSAREHLDFDRNFESTAWIEFAVALCKEAGLEFGGLERAPSSDHIVFLTDEKFVLKIFRPWRNCFERESKALDFARRQSTFRTPEIVSAGNFDGLDYLIMTRVPGRTFTRAEFMRLSKGQQVGVICQLAAGLKQLHQMDAGGFEDDWDQFVRDRADTFIERQIAHGVNQKAIEALPGFIEANLPSVPTAPTSFLHGDVHFGNLRLVGERGVPRIGGLFDFADSRRGFHEYEFLAVGVLMLQGERELQREFFTAYGYKEGDLDETMRKRLMMLTMLYETSDLRRYALRLRPEAIDFTLEELERAIWSFV